MGWREYRRALERRPDSEDWVEVVPPRSHIMYTWDNPWISPRLLLDGKWRDGSDTWGTSLSLRRTFARRPVEGSDVAVGLSALAGPLKLLKIEPSDHRDWPSPLPDLSPYPLQTGAVRQRLRNLARTHREIMRHRYDDTSRRLRLASRTIKSDAQWLLGGAKPGQPELLLSEERQAASTEVRQRLFVRAEVGQLCASVVSAAPVELLQLTLCDAELDFAIQPQGEKDEAEGQMQVLSLGLSLGMLQLDNQHVQAALPVILAPFERLTQLDGSPSKTFDMSLRCITSFSGLDYIQTCSIALAPLSLQIEEAFVEKLVAFAQASGIVDLLDWLGEAAGEPTGDAWESSLAPAKPQLERVRNVVIDNLQISSISLQLTLLTLPSVPQDAVSRAKLVFFALFGNIDHMPIYFPPFTVSRHLTSMERLQFTAIRHYAVTASQLVATLLLSIGSLGLQLGPTVDLTRDLFSLLLRPAASELRHAGTGVAVLRQEAVDFARSLVYFLARFVRVVSSTWGRNISLLTCDPEYFTYHTMRDAMGERVNTVLDGFVEGLIALFVGVAGLRGVVVKPFRGAVDGGGRGFAVGTARGLLCVWKPVIGALDLVSKLSEGLAKTARRSKLDRLGRRFNAPLPLRTDGLVRPFVADEARAYDLLSLCRIVRGRASAELYIGHHKIDYRPRRGSKGRVTAGVVLVTSWRVVFGIVEPFVRVMFETPLERMARVELQPPYTHIIMWTWQDQPAMFGESESAKHGSVINFVMERHIPGTDPRQLHAAFQHLRLLANQDS